ncbi:MAG: hypothetical protein GXO29_03840 [Thermotogae bacterium]|nr:hypothetical protein [Thermotogota bacterium]
MEFVNLSDWEPDEKLKEAVLGALEDVGVDAGGITVAFVDRDYMASLKERFFGVKESTDVLTFTYDDVREVVVCPAHLGYDPHEIARRIFHGILHALGHDHKVKSKAPKMEKLEKALMEAFRRRYG